MSVANISCTIFPWSTNSLGQSPCEIAEHLNSVCTPLNDSYFTELNSSTEYTLSASDQNSCLCTTVVYNLVSLCRLCQSNNLEFATWVQWSANCSTVDTGFPPGLPSGTAVPDWAYQNVTGSSFNITIASEVATTDHTESSSSASPSSTTSLLSSAASSSSTSEPAPIEGTSHSMAIVGGLIGGLIGVGFLAVAILFFTKRRERSNLAPSAAYLQASGGLGDTASRGQYAPVEGGLKTQQPIPFLPYSIVSRSQDHSSFSFDPYSDYTKTEPGTSPPGFTTNTPTVASPGFTAEAQTRMPDGP